MDFPLSRRACKQEGWGAAVINGWERRVSNDGLCNRKKMFSKEKKVEKRERERDLIGINFQTRVGKILDT